MPWFEVRMMLEVDNGNVTPHKLFQAIQRSLNTLDDEGDEYIHTTVDNLHVRRIDPGEERW